MGGRAAEELIYGTQKITTGATSDLKYATEIATMMVKQAGFSEKVRGGWDLTCAILLMVWRVLQVLHLQVGLRTFDNRRNDVLVVVNDISPTTNETIDNEIKRLLQVSHHDIQYCYGRH